MTTAEFKSWLSEIKQKTPAFVERMKANPLGRYKLTVSGDMLDENSHTGLAQATFAIRVLFILNELKPEQVPVFKNFINSFKNGDDSFSDPCIVAKTRWRRMFDTIKYFDYKYVSDFYTKNAETRQALAALYNIGELAECRYYPIRPEEKTVTDFVRGLNWRSPWAAASHVNHLLFFTKYNTTLSEDEKQTIYDTIERSLNYYRKTDGFLYADESEVSSEQKIGGMMKALMGLDTAGRESKWLAPEITDFCLKYSTDREACENFNTMFVLHRCHALDYRRCDIHNFALSRARVWQDRYYWANHGGFSFYAGRAQNRYYGANVSKGLPEPDLHGTAMFIWGLYLIADMLDLNKQFNLRQAVL